jgi:large subunit ribosomal protein L3
VCGAFSAQVQNLTVFKVDEVRQLVYVKGHVPGNAGGFVRIADAVKGPEFPGGPGAPFPFPTYFEGRSSSVDRPSVRYAPAPDADPLKPTDDE